VKEFKGVRSFSGVFKFLKQIFGSMKSDYLLTGLTNSLTKTLNHVGYLCNAPFFDCLVLQAQRFKYMHAKGKLRVNRITLMDLNAITRTREYCN
jgi:hypothetical protein